jgi:hypothetical protein
MSTTSNGASFECREGNLLLFDLFKWALPHILDRAS